MATIFYKHKNFCGERARVSMMTSIVESTKLFAHARTDAQQQRKQQIIFDTFGTVTFEQIGILHGEYLVLNEFALLDRNGMLIIIGTASDDVTWKAICEGMNGINSETKKMLIDHWDTFPGVQNVAIATDRYCSNYWHYTLEFIPRFRWYDHYDVDSIVLAPSSIEKAFQRDLIIKAVGNRRVTVLSGVLRLINPVIAFGSITVDGIRWLRSRMDIAVSSGMKRYYIRRAASISRKKVDGRVADRGGLVEDASLENFLEHFGFQTVEFGVGDISVVEQVQKLDGAQIILSSHGAQLTNILYLHAPLTVIEVLGPVVYSASVMLIANTLGFRYYGIASDLTDEVGNLVVDYEKLYAIMGEIVDGGGEE